MLHKKLELDGDSKKSHPALARVARSAIRELSCATGHGVRFMYVRVSHSRVLLHRSKLSMSRKMFGLPIALVLILSCAGFLLSHAMAQDQKLTGMAAWNQLVGNSITGEEDGKTLVE